MVACADRLIASTVKSGCRAGHQAAAAPPIGEDRTTIATVGTASFSPRETRDGSYR